jgi:CubicO group peptidase (beta-lactamase class C family)
MAMRTAGFVGSGLVMATLAACHSDPVPAPPATPAAPAALVAAQAGSGSAAALADDALVGLWHARRRFGPDARGPLMLQRGPDGWTADFVGRRVAVRDARGELAFELPGDQGSFRGRLVAGGRIAGHWTPPPSVIHGSRFAVPVVLAADGDGRWRGEIAPLDDTFTLYLKVARRADGTLGAFLRNPDRNIGVRYDVDHLVHDGSAVKLIGRRNRGPAGTTLLAGSFDAGAEVLTLAFPERGGSYDFRRDGDDSEFYPRGAHPGRYAYRPPPALADGWPTATLDEVGISRAGIEAFVQALIDLPIDSVHAPEVHGVLIARHGKLVLEEYFHGEHRDRMHDTRSAAKSLTATLIGAAIQAGAPLSLATPVYRIMNGGAVPAGLDPRKQAMTLEHLVSMRSGLFCDDGNPAAPGNEDAISEQTDDPDYYHVSLAVPMADAPDRVSVYCSMNPNLALGVLGRATGEPGLDMFDRLIGGPLQIARYAWPLDPAGQVYGGGGVRMLPRDFMKLGQVMLDGGAWHGQRILGREFAARAGGPLHALNGIQYGYLWWNVAYPYKDRTLRASFAAGNGGQAVMAIPALDLVVAIYAGNYSDGPVAIHVQQDLVPTYVLPAVREAGDDPSAPVAPRPFISPYGRTPPPAPATR